MKSFAWWSVRHRWWVIGGWVLLVVGLLLASQAAGGPTFKNNFSFSGYDSQRAQALLREHFPQAAGDSDQIVVHTTTGTVHDPAVRDQLEAMFAEVAHLPHVVGVADPYTHAQAVSADAKTAFAVVTFDAQANSVPKNAIATVVDTARAARTPTVQVELLGQAITQSESSGPSQATAVGLGVSVLVLLVLFGSVVAMLMPLLTALTAIAAGIGVNALISHAMDMNTATEAIALMIALGVGVDYSLFIVSRFRSLLGEGRDRREAAVGAVDTSGRAVLFAGAIVVLALLGMLLFGLSITNGIAVGAAVEVLFTMAAALTLLPAVLSLIGPRVNSLRVPGRRPAGSGISPRLSGWAHLVRRARWVLAPATTVLLIALSLPLLSLRLGASDASLDQHGTTTYKAYQQLSEGFGPGFGGPLLLAVTLPAPTQTPVLQQVASAVAAEPGVASVGAPQFSPTGTAAVLRVYPKTSPQDAATGRLVHRLRDTVVPHAVAGSGVTVYVGGPTATYIDLGSLLARGLVPFIAIVLAIGFVLLLVVFRSVAIPLTATVLNLLSIGAALGVVVGVFQHGWTGLPSGPVDFAVPVMMFAIAFGLSTDYQVFLLTRVQEEWHTHGDNDRAVHDGISRVSGIITGAAIIMIAVFGSFMLGGQRILQEFGAGLAVGVALDAFLIRFALVPAVMYIVGDRNWSLPTWLRWLPRVHIEPEAEVEVETETEVVRSGFPGSTDPPSRIRRHWRAASASSPARGSGSSTDRPEAGL